MRAPPPSDAAVLEEIVGRLVGQLNAEQVFLYGSRAGGDAEHASDFDALAVVADSELPGYARDRIALRALRGSNQEPARPGARRAAWRAGL